MSMLYLVFYSVLLHIIQQKQNNNNNTTRKPDQRYCVFCAVLYTIHNEYVVMFNNKYVVHVLWYCMRLTVTGSKYILYAYRMYVHVQSTHE